MSESRFSATRTAPIRQKYGHGDLQNELAPVEVAQFAVKRRDNGGGQHIGRDDPGQMRNTANLRDNGGQRGRDDGLVQCRQKQHEAEREEHHEDGPP